VGVDHARLDRPPAMEVMRQLLDAWRTAEREVVAADGSPELPRIQAHAATLRMLYQGLFAQVHDEHSARTRA